MFTTKETVIECVVKAHHRNGAVVDLMAPVGPGVVLPSASANATADRLEEEERNRRRIHLRLQTAEESTRIMFYEILHDVPEGMPLQDEHFRRLRDHLVRVQRNLAVLRSSLGFSEFTQSLLQAKIRVLDQQWLATSNLNNFL